MRHSPIIAHRALAATPEEPHEIIERWLPDLADLLQRLLSWR
jgi:hypothetical protein